MTAQTANTTCKWDPSVNVNSRETWAEFHEAVAAGRVAGPECGSFWKWLEAAHPNPNAHSASPRKPDAINLDVSGNSATEAARIAAIASQASFAPPAPSASITPAPARAAADPKPARSIDVDAIYRKQNKIGAKIDGTDAAAVYGTRKHQRNK